MGRTVFLSGFVAFASTILAQTPGTFTATGNMTTPRASHSATLLPNGKVLITGAPIPRQSAYTQEFYDPAMRAFASTGGTATVNGIATVLGNGKVLIIGAGDSAQLYDPATDTFTPTGSYVGPSTTAISTTRTPPPYFRMAGS